MNWDEQSERTDVIHYCATRPDFLLENLWEEEILITAYPVSHVKQGRYGESLPRKRQNDHEKYVGFKSDEL